MCTGSKLVGDRKGTCHSRNAVGLVNQLMMELEDRDLASEVIVSATSCYGICDKGPVMVVYPDGVWYGNLDASAIEAIAEEHLEGGVPVEEYRI
jgi:(2Fe-2S) ferredoxin